MAKKTKLDPSLKAVVKAAGNPRKEYAKAAQNVGDAFGAYIEKAIELHGPEAGAEIIEDAACLVFVQYATTLAMLGTKTAQKFGIGYLRKLAKSARKDIRKGRSLQEHIDSWGG